MAGSIAAVLLIIIFTPILLQWVFFILRAVATRFSSIGQRGVQSDRLPPAHLVLLKHQPLDLAVRCKAQGVPGAGGRNGFVIVWRDHLVFTYDRWGSSGSEP